ncbi:MAG: cbb3-type cytochrome oxidase assembly protein CcoS [Myxococcales bacterium]|nr:cbb3-type cytochrome oxidase assembly protein CcoS [Polyangiaceae bacterium]MDW8248618.1 cbb3-type cytochrome oxidase assembly protein CcoS [Myxococcales bacterium]
MEVVFLLVFVSGVLVACSIGGFIYSIRNDEHEHVDRLALAPLRDDNEAPRRA